SPWPNPNRLRIDEVRSNVRESSPATHRNIEVACDRFGDMKQTITIAFESANQPDVIALIEELDAYQIPLYPAESHHGIDISALSRPNVLFLVARTSDGD